MPYIEHTPVKPEKLAAAAATALEGETSLPNLFQRESFDPYVGSEGDYVTIKVEGLLPWRNYAWRNDRSQPIQFDTYAERKYSLRLGDTLYNAVKLTDEQYKMDFGGWSKLVVKQGEALGRGLQFKAAEFLTKDENYDITVGIHESNMDAGLRRLRRIARSIHMPGSPVLIVGADVEEALLADPRLNLSSAVSDGRAESALAEATIGRLRGFSVVVDDGLAPDTAVLLGQGACVMAQAAPAVPASVKFGATGSTRGFATRLIQQYNHMYLQDESVLNAWYGFRTIKDPLLGVDENGTARISDKEFQVRAIKVTLNGTGAFSTGTATDLTDLTGVKSADLTVGEAVDGGTIP